MAVVKAQPKAPENPVSKHLHHLFTDAQILGAALVKLLFQTLRQATPVTFAAPPWRVQIARKSQLPPRVAALQTGFHLRTQANSNSPDNGLNWSGRQKAISPRPGQGGPSDRPAVASTLPPHASGMARRASAGKPIRKQPSPSSCKNWVFRQDTIRGLICCRQIGKFILPNRRRGRF